MANFPKPWFRKNRGWFVTVGGRQVSLGADKDQAFQRYHKLMAEAPAPAKSRSDSVLGVFERYLQWCSEHRAPDTYEWYRWRLQLFTESIDKDLTADYLVKSNFAMLIQKLSAHYGIPGVSGSQIRRVPLPPDCPRGGFLTQAAILKVTANGTTTSPVPGLIPMPVILPFVMSAQSGVVPSPGTSFDRIVISPPSSFVNAPGYASWTLITRPLASRVTRARPDCSSRFAARSPEITS